MVRYAAESQHRGVAGAGLTLTTGGSGERFAAFPVIEGGDMTDRENSPAYQRAVKPCLRSEGHYPRHLLPVLRA
jgi:hypothetical protein